MSTLILAVLLGLGLFALNAWKLKGIVDNINAMPSRRTPRYLITRYFYRLVLLVIILGFLVLWFGLKFGLATLGGVVLGQVLLFLVSGGFGKGGLGSRIAGRE
ncbi:MAG: hypothetical protein ACM3NT_02785 [Methylocystaceae bacterium]